MQGNIPGGTGPGLDNTSRQFSLLLNSVTDYAIYMLDAEGYVRTWNPGGERIKGYATNEVIGTHFSRFYRPEEVALGLPLKNLETARTQGRYAGEGWRVRKDGTYFHASVVIDPIWENGQLLGYAKITRDITERYQAEQRLELARKSLLQAQKMEAVGMLTLGLAHDFNNLLTIVVNSLDLIGARAQEQRTSQLVETALRASERGIVLTRQLLAFGRGQHLAPEPVDINALIGEAEELLHRCVGEPIEVTYRLATPLPIVELDKSQLEAALLNLVSNSRDAIPGRGSIVITTSMHRGCDPAKAEQSESEFVRVAVTDTGAGIPYEHQPRVFEPFFTTKEVGRGSGLGLSQVFGFASQSGGYAELCSTPGKGTTVTLNFRVPGAGDAD